MASLGRSKEKTILFVAIGVVLVSVITISVVGVSKAKARKAAEKAAAEKAIAEQEAAEKAADEKAADEHEPQWNIIDSRTLYVKADDGVYFSFSVPSSVQKVYVNAKVFDGSLNFGIYKDAELSSELFGTVAEDKEEYEFESYLSEGTYYFSIYADSYPWGLRGAGNESTKVEVKILELY